MIEDIINFGKFASLVGILTQNKPNISPPLCVIFINAGFIPKIGPNRLYVKLARLFAEKDISSFRFDFSGIGDSEISKCYGNRIHIDEIRESMDLITSITGTKNFILMGICSGAEKALEVALEDHRIVGLSLIDGTFLDRDLFKSIFNRGQKYTSLRFYKKNALNLHSWIRIFRGHSKIVETLKSMLRGYINIIVNGSLNGNIHKNFSKIVRNAVTNDYEIQKWKQVLARNVKIHLIFCEGGIAIDIYNLTIASSLKNYNDLLFSYLKDVDHTFTPVWAQNLLVSVTSKWIQDSFYMQNS